MARHFSVDKRGSAAGGYKNFTALDWLHFLGRFLLCLAFLHAVLFNLSNIDAVSAKLAAQHWLPEGAEVPVVLAAIVLAFIGSALFFTASDPLSFLLLALFIVPHTLYQHALPLLQLSPSSSAFHAHLVAALQSVAVLGALLVVWTYTEHIAWLEVEQKAEVRRALEEFYRRQQGGGGGTEVAEVAEHKREPKKVK